MKTHLTLLPALALVMVGCDSNDSGQTGADTFGSDTTAPDTTSPDTTSPDIAPPDSTSPEVAPPDTDRLPSEVVFGEVDSLLTLVGDLDGDGRADLVTSSREDARVVVQTGWPDGPQTELGYVRDSTALRGAVGDLNHDGVRDLVLSSVWDHRVEVYFGPFDGTAKPRSASFHLARNPGGGLADLFGATVLVADLSGDGKDDLLVTAPGEGEEACFGTRASLVYFGPLAAGPGSTDDGAQPVLPEEDDGMAPSRILPATPGVCLGDYAFVLKASRGEALVLSLSREPYRVAYGLPLSAQATPLTEENSPPLPDMDEVSGRIDVDGDALADESAFDEASGGPAWSRSSDGDKVSLAQRDHYVRLFGVDLDGDGVGAAWLLAERFESSDYTQRVVLAPLPASATGLVDFAELTPSWSGTRYAGNDSAITRGDLDGDGVPELAVGNALIRSSRSSSASE
ncbi:MAG TPA: FG-GAP and VCBS repeat-containing protein [Myxococcota bacterium]|nr:FG-GAP and VCBS repeat-containing protein [Myxococcota bacterium]